MYGELEALEYEDLEDMELEYLGEDEYEDWEDLEFEDLGEYEYEDWEGDPFLGGLLKRFAGTAAKTVGRAIAGPTGANIGGWLANSVFREGEFEDEYESEAEFEAEFEAEGGNPDVLEEMEYWAELAAETESEAEADEFLGVLTRLARPLLSSVFRESYEDMELYEDYEDYEDFEDYEDYEDYEYEADPFFGAIASLAAPLIGKGIGALGRWLRRRRRRRRPRRSREFEYEAAIKAIPKIAAKTAVTLKRQKKAGRPITRKKVAAAMAKSTAKALKSKKALAKSARRNRMAANRARVKKGQVRAARRRVLPVRTTRRLPV